MTTDGLHAVTSDFNARTCRRIFYAFIYADWPCAVCCVHSAPSRNGIHHSKSYRTFIFKRRVHVCVWCAQSNLQSFSVSCNFEKSKSHAFKCNCIKNLRIIHYESIMRLPSIRSWTISPRPIVRCTICFDFIDSLNSFPSDRAREHEYRHIQLVVSELTNVKCIRL